MLPVSKFTIVTLAWLRPWNTHRYEATVPSQNVARTVADHCAQGFELFPNSAAVKQFSFEAGTACEFFEQRIASEPPREPPSSSTRPGRR